MLRISPYLLALAACHMAWSLAEDNDNYGDEIAVIEKRIDVKEIVHFKKRRHLGSGYEWENDDTLYFMNKARKSNTLTSLLSGLKVKDSGHADVCGPPGADVNIAWTPKTILKNQPVNISVSMTTPCEFMEGNLKVDVYIANLPEPVMSLEKAVSCETIPKKYQIKCPIPKGKSINFQYQSHDTDDIPTGQFKVVGNLTVKGELCLCLKATVDVA